MTFSLVAHISSIYIHLLDQIFVQVKHRVQFAAKVDVWKGRSTVLWLLKDFGYLYIFTRRSFPLPSLFYPKSTLNRHIFQSACSLGLMRCFNWDSASNWNTGLWVWQRPLLLLYSVTSSEGLSSLPCGLLLCRDLNHFWPTNPPCWLYAGHDNQNLNIFLHNLKTKSHYTQPRKFSAFLSKTQQTMVLTFHFHTHTHTFPNFSLKWNKNK